MQKFKKKIKILITSNDIGSTEANLSIVNYLYKKNKYEIYACASKVTYDRYLNNSNLFKKVYLYSPTKIDHIFNLNNFTFLIAGLSINKNGIDTKLIKLAKSKSIKVGVIQDFFGHVGSLSKYLLPDIFWITDNDSLKITKSIFPKIKYNLIGYIKYLNFKYYPKKSNQLTDSILIIGQPLKYKSIKLNTQKLIIFLIKNFSKKFNINYLPHPGCHNLHKINKCKKINNESINYIDIENSNIKYNYLVTSKIVITLFSTVGLDHSYLNSQSKKPIGNLIYYVPNSLSLFMKKVLGTNKIPHINLGLGIQLRSLMILKSKVSEFTNNSKARKSYHKSSKLFFTSNSKSLQTIEGDLLEKIKS